MDKECEFCVLNEVGNEYIIYDSEYWIVYLADNQNYPGRCIIPLKRHCESLSALTDEEWEEFHRIIKALEHIVVSRFNASNCNWTCLMNGGFVKKPYNPHVHFHFIPRYFDEQCSADTDFIDENAAAHYTMSTEYQLSVEKRRELVKQMSDDIKELFNN